MPPDTIFALTPPQQFHAIVDSIKPGCMLGEHNTNAVAFRVVGEFDLDIFQNAFDLVTARHRVLRGGLVEIEEGRLAFAIRDLPVRVARHDMGDVARPGDTYRDIATRLSRRPISAYDPPLVRIHAVDLGSQGWLLVLEMHEFIGDGGSVRAMLRELSQAYRSIEDGVPLPPLPMDYLDYFAAHGTPTDDVRAFWRSYLAGMPVDSFPTDHSKAAARSPVLDQVAVTLSEDFLGSVGRLARATRSTPFMVMLAAYAVVVSEATKSMDVVVPTWWSGREDPATENLVGLFLRVLPIRVKIDPEDTFQGLLQRVRRSAVEAFAHATIPTISLISEVPEAAAAFADPEYCWSNFQVSYGATESDFQFAKADSVRVFFQANTDAGELAADDSAFSEELHFRIVIEPQVIRINVVFDRSLFEPATVTAFLKRFTELLAHVTGNPGAKLYAPKAT